MPYSVNLNVRVINGKERFRFHILFCLRVWQSFEMEVFSREGEGVILTDKPC